MPQPNLLKLLKQLKHQNVTKKNQSQRNELIHILMNKIDNVPIKPKLYKLTKLNIQFNSIINI